MSAVRTRRRTSGGAALIMALFTVTIVTALAVTFAAVARTDVLLAGNRAASIQALYAAQSGLNYCRTVLADDDAAVDSLLEDWALVDTADTGLNIPRCAVTPVIDDESARLNLNATWVDETALLILPGMTQEAADGILDWRDRDDTPMTLGAESDYYLTLSSPYYAANQSFQTIDELRLVRGVTPALFDGDGSDTLPGLRNLVTVHSGERNVDAEGQARLNVNTAGAGALAARLSGVLTANEVAAVVARVQQGRLTSLGQLLSISAVRWQRMAQALDRVRISDSDFVEGTVNLNTADAAVLEAIGLSADVAQAVIKQRASAALETKGDLADISGVDQAMMRVVADRIATKSSVFRVSAYAQPEGRPLRVGVAAFLDRSATPPTLAQWHEEVNLPATQTAVVGTRSGNGS